MKYNVALLHYSCPPVVGGVEEIIRQHASLLNRYYHNVKVFSGDGGNFADNIEIEINPLFGSRNSHVLKAHHEGLEGKPKMMEDLFSWLSTSTQHPLIKSAVFHYELKFIHPFVEGNSRIGCLWQTHMLKQWNPLFALFPVEDFIAATKEQYDSAINESTDTGDSSVFIEYILENTLDVILSINNTLFSNREYVPASPQAQKNTAPQETQQVKALIDVLRQSENALNRKQLQAKLKLKDRKHFRERYLKPAMDAGLIEMTIPEKPNSKLQKYRLM